MHSYHNNNSLISAGVGVRGFAYLIDLLIKWSFVGVARLFFFISRLGSTFLGEPVLFSFSILDIIAYFIGVSYFILLVYCSGVTVGKFLLNIKVIPYESPAEEGTGKKLKLFDVVFRETVGRYLSGLMLAGYIVAVFHPQKRAIHDILGNTRVVYSFGRKIAASSPTPVIAATPIATPIQPSATDGDGI